MLKEERHKIILNEIALHNRILLTDMSENLNVSIDTIRRDVTTLDAHRKLKKVHGGAVSLGYVDNNADHDKVYALKKKKVIVQKAIQLLKNGNVIIIHGGTTCLELARNIPPKLSLTCFTLSLPVAMELCKKPKVEVIFIGGTIAKESKIASGGQAIHTLSKIMADYSFIGSGYVDASYGLTEFDWESVQIKMGVIKSSKSTVLLTISDKLSSTNRYKTSNLSDISTMITELDPNNKALSMIKESGVQLL